MYVYLQQELFLLFTLLTSLDVCRCKIYHKNWNFSLETSFSIFLTHLGMVAVNLVRMTVAFDT